MDDLSILVLCSFIFLVGSLLLRNKRPTEEDQGHQRNVPLSPTAAALGGGHYQVPVGSPIEVANDPLRRNVAAQILNPEELTSTQKNLHLQLPMKYGKRLVTVACNKGILFSGDATNAESISWILHLRRIADVYLIVCISNESEKEGILRRLSDIGLIGTNKTVVVASHKVLFASTPVGKRAMVRQLEPQVHIEHDSQVITELVRFIPRIIYVVSGDENTSFDASVVHTTPDLDTYFKLMDLSGTSSSTTTTSTGN